MSIAILFISLVLIKLSYSNIKLSIIHERTAFLPLWVHILPKDLISFGRKKRIKMSNHSSESSELTSSQNNASPPSLSDHLSKQVQVVLK